MERQNRILERKFFISVIVLMTVSYYFVINDFQKNEKTLMTSYKNMHGELLDTQEQLNKCDDWVLFLEEEPNDVLIATTYNNTVEQTNKDNYHTASMFHLDSLDQYQHKIIAVSQDLKKDYPFGSKIYINGTGKYDGIWTVQDFMNERHVRRIDFLINEDMDIGEWAVTVKKIE